jgi:hypothetical protein
MKRFLAVPFAITGATLALSLFASPAHAQASRTWVSGVGDDANPCSRTAPCKTYAGAISKTAVNGEINCIEPGGFGAVTITKSITIDCHEVFASILNAGTDGINVAFDSFAATDVRKTVNIRNINIQGFDSGIIGIRIFGAGGGSFVNIEDSLINGNFGSTATGLLDQRTSGALTILNTTVRDMGVAGISISSTGAGGLIRATLSNVRVINAVTGIIAGNGTEVLIGRSIVDHNNTAGVSVAAGSSTNIDSTIITHSAVGVKNLGTVHLSNNDFGFNDNSISGTVNSFTNNRFSDVHLGGTITPIGSPSNPTGQQ